MSVHTICTQFLETGMASIYRRGKRWRAIVVLPTGRQMTRGVAADIDVIAGGD
ncbi:MAG: hypothetical protein HOH36_09835 [Acidimicrobiaceae bacterium]|nr:hypothetical protein [Acidimicrobiaceae bacterium]MBT5850724.1 hypothetical protein [Acidimicrobiaceae bacterium]